MWRNEGSEDGDTVDLVYFRLQDRLLWDSASPQKADVFHLKFRTKTSREAVKASPSAALSIPSHRSAVQDTSNAALNCQGPVTVRGLSDSCMLTLHPREVLSNQYTL